MQKRIRVSVEDALSMAMELQQRGQLEEAVSVYRNVLQTEPRQPDALHFLGVAMHRLGDSEDGIDYIMKSLEIAPDNPAAVNNLGNVYRESGRLEEAEAAYRRVLDFAPDHADTLVNLGIILRAQKQPQKALDIIEKAIGIDPNHASAYHNLGNVYRSLKRYDDALEAYNRSNELSPDDDKSLLSIATVLQASGKTEDALDVLRGALNRFPGHASATHLLAAFSGENVPDRASDSYVVELFDSFSDSFDEALQRLDYRAPDLVAEKVGATLGSEAASLTILDIGCGTGLCGPLLRPLAKSLVGVDLSPRMLRKAEKRHCYDQLEEAELTAFMLGAPGQYDLLVCVDTFVYFGDLGAAFDAAAGSLRSPGYLFFTVERHDASDRQQDYWLRDHGRYSHTEDYIRQSLARAGFDVLALDRVHLRKEKGQPVEGMLLAASTS